MRPNGRVLARALVAALLAATTTVPARSQDRPAGDATAVADEILERRLRFIEDRLRARQTHGQIWHWSWMTIDVASAAVLGVVAARARHEDDAVNNGVQAAVSAIGVADLVFRPLQARFGADRLDAMPEGSRAEKEAKLRAAEDQLRGNAARAAERESLAMHAANVALNGAAGLIIALAGRPADGAIAFASGTAGGVLNILTQPAAPERDWQEYRAFAGRPVESVRLHLQPRLLADGGGLAIIWVW